jgi:hypothetical protein
MEYLRVDRLCPLILSADSSRVLMWYVNASFAEHPNILIYIATLVED